MRVSGFSPGWRGFANNNAEPPCGNRQLLPTIPLRGFRLRLYCACAGLNKSIGTNRTSDRTPHSLLALFAFLSHFSLFALLFCLPSLPTRCIGEQFPYLVKQHVTKASRLRTRSSEGLLVCTLSKRFFSSLSPLSLFNSRVRRWPLDKVCMFSPS